MTDDSPADNASADDNVARPASHGGAYHRAELRRLASAQCDETISRPELARLETLLENFAEARRDYVAYLDIHTGLDWEITSAEAILNQRPVACEIEHVSQSAWLRSLRYRAIAAGVLAASLLVSVAWWFLTNSSGISDPDWRRALANAGPSTTVARVSRQSADCRWSIAKPDGTAGSSSDSSEPLRSRDTILLEKGQLELTFASGVVVTLDGDALFEVVSPMRAVAIRGRLRAHVNRGAEGFTIETPRATVVDLGTVFGLEVGDAGQTDVVVFRGKVDLHYDGDQSLAEPRQHRRLQMGEALRVDDQGQAQRIVSVDSTRFVEMRGEQERTVRPSLIVSVQDNIRQPDKYNYYEIVRGGLREDAKAFVDREFHEFNGVDADGLPSYLVGCDYVKMFNDDKVAETIEVYVTLADRARLFVLFDDRTTPPDWLVEDFRDTGDDVGMDVGEYTDHQGKWITHYSPGEGPGVSVDNILSVWERKETSPGTIRLGSTQATTISMNMYGIVAAPLAE